MNFYVFTNLIQR